METSNASEIRRGFMFVLSSPSGAGKTTLSRRLLGSHDGLTMSISVTTRPKRPGEIDGKDYYFEDVDTFNQMVDENKLLEHAKVFEHYYGTPNELVESSLIKGVDVLFDIDWQGTRQLKEKRRDDLVSVFILPPSLDELERRLRGRGQDSEDVVKHRMAKAAAEISHWEEYDYVVVNEDLDVALAKIVHILEAERSKRIRQTNLPHFIDSLCNPKAKAS
ncbi:MAG: guanylate kinase [Rickettsiales bacterium]|nr:guanylate kinase [Rickettsiales bacterium]